MKRLLKIKPLLRVRLGSELQRYHILMAGSFLLLVILLAFLSDRLPHPYAVGLFLIGPVGIIVGLLTGSYLGNRRINQNWPFSAAVALLGVWIFVFLDYLRMPDVSTNPACAILAVGVGTAYYFLFMLIGLTSSKSEGRQNGH